MRIISKKLFAFIVLLTCFTLYLFHSYISDARSVASDSGTKKTGMMEKKKNQFLKNSHPAEKDGWQLLFDDEFNSEKLNKRWTVLEREKNYNNELEAYKKENVRISGGRLHLIGLKEASGEDTYTSGLIQTKDKLQFLYGKVEVKGKFPAGKGLFPAIWLLGSDERNPLSEIDILESIGSKPEEVYMVHHWKGNGNLNTRFGKSIVNTYNEDHVYSMEWGPQELRWYIDGNLVFSTNDNIPDSPMYLIMNLAIGGNWPGNPDSNTTFPSEFSIDYVKIYQKEGE